MKINPALPFLAAGGWDALRLAAIYAGAAVACYVSLAAIGRRFKQRAGVRLGAVYQIFCIAAALYVPALLPQIDLPSEREMGAVLAVSASFVAIAFVRRYFWDALFPAGGTRHPPELLGQILAILIVGLTVLTILNFNYGIRIPGLLTGSGIAAVIIGLAMQDTLGNVLAGFALYFGKPFQIGDWLLINDHHAEVMEITWRSVRLRTNDHVWLDVPNNSIAKQTIVNFHYPTPLHSNRIQIGVNYDSPPSLVKKVLYKAALDADHVVCEPPPRVLVKEFGPYRVVYEIQFWLQDHEYLLRALSSIRSNAWYALRRNSITIPPPIELQYHGEMEAVREHTARVRDALRGTPFAAWLDDWQLGLLLKHARIVHFGAGERIVQQGDADDVSMYVLVTGQASVQVEATGSISEVAMLGAGDCIGEMSLLTGEKRSATVIATEDCEAVKVRKEAISAVIQQNPDVMRSLSEMLAQRRLRNEGVLAANAEANAARKQEYTAGFFQMLQSFFRI